MSALQTVSGSSEENDGHITDNKDKKKFYWNQPVAVSAYLIALAAGNLSSRDISTRVRVWSEPEVVEAALFEFAETEKFVAAAEQITGNSSSSIKSSSHDMMT